MATVAELFTIISTPNSSTSPTLRSQFVTLLAKYATEPNVTPSTDSLFVIGEKLYGYVLPSSAVTPPPAPETTHTTTTTSPSPSPSSSTNEDATSCTLPILSPTYDEYTTNPYLPLLTLYGSPNTYLHPVSATTAELNVNARNLPGVHTKNIFLKDKKHGMFLVVARHDADTNTKFIASELKLSGANMRMATEELLLTHLNAKKGCLGPMCIVNDIKHEVKLVIDKKLLDGGGYVCSHPGRNDMSTCMEGGELVRFCKSVGHEVVMVDFNLKSEDAGDAKGGSGPLDIPGSAKKEDKPKQAKQKKAPLEKQAKDSSNNETLLALQYKKAENFGAWYSDVIVLSEMISYYDISGCYILRPWSYKIWEFIQVAMNVKMGEVNVDNCYFPLFVSKSRLETEKSHVEGFAPEVAWVTKSGDEDLAEPIAIRPTSETIMYPSFKDWIRSHRDLPLKINQWSNVVRWEFKYPTPFLRSREFLWQEGHTAHATHKESDEMVMTALEMYRSVYEDLLAVPVIRGYKTEKEKFAGGAQTTTCEAFIPMAGRAIQGATSHNLGQNFGKMFDIKFQGADGESHIPYQTSWGLTTRSIGVSVMVHGDDKGLVLPPMIAPVQVVIVPITSKNVTYESITPYCLAIKDKLSAAGIRVKFDDRSIYSPGWKYNHWEQKGVPVRFEVGPKDIDQMQVRSCIRVDGAKENVSVEGIEAYISKKLLDIQKTMFDNAKTERDSRLVTVMEWKDFTPNLEKQNLILTPWCGPEFQDWEEVVKEKSRAEGLALSASAEGEEEDSRTAVSVAGKSLCIPFEQPPMPDGTLCFCSGLPAKVWCLWGRSY